MWSSVGLVKTEVPGKCVASIFRGEENAQMRKIVRRLLTDIGFFQDPNGATLQKRAFFIVTAVKTSNPINYGKFKHF
jgi:hypothetical protein